jgi:hypothetical protein
MNQLVSRLCQLSRHELVRSPTTALLADLNVVAERFVEVGPIPSALLLRTLIDDSQYMQPVHIKLVNRLSRTIDISSAEIPPTLAIQLFNRLAEFRHHSARRVLASVQSKWFDNWRPASVDRGSRRPKLKQTFIGAYSDDAILVSRISHSGIIKNLDDTTLAEAVDHVVTLYELEKSGFRDVALISNALAQEQSRRSGQASEKVMRFIQNLGAES